MAGDFQSLTLGMVCSKIGSGATPRGGKEAYRGGATSLIRSQNIYNDRFVHDGLAFLDDKQADGLRNVAVEVGDVLLNITGDSVARCCQVDPDVLPARVNQHVAIIRPWPEVLDARFLRYSLVSPTMQAQLLARASAGATRKALTKGMLKSLVIKAPTLPEQRAIAHILGSLDDKIELNRRMNKTLEVMARASFKDWFVDFGPVRAKMENREPYLPREVWDLFPDRLVASELGEIPEGWKQNTLADLTILNPESWSRKAPPSEIEYVDLANTKWGQIEKTSRMTWEHAPSRAQRILRPGDSILGTVRPGNGSYALIGSDGLTGSTGFAVLRPRHDAGKAAVYLAATSGENIDRLAYLADGGVYPAVSPEAVLATPLVLPEINTPKASILQAFSDTVDALLDSIEQRKSESKNLAGMRDTLLPKLISGELRVPNVLRQCGEEVVA